MYFKCIDCGKKRSTNKRLIKVTFGTEGVFTLYRCKTCWNKLEKHPTKKDMSGQHKIKRLARMYKSIRKV